MACLTQISRSEAPVDAAQSKAVELLDRALADQQRAVRLAEGSMVSALMQPQMRWDLVAAARNLIASQLPH